MFLNLLLAGMLFIGQCFSLPNPTKSAYTDSWGNEIPGLITNETWMTPFPEYVSGKAVFYGPFAMDATAEYRRINYEEEDCLGGVSLMSPYNIGDKAWVKLQGEWRGPFCVADCAKRGDEYSIVVYRQEVIEINFELALEIGMVDNYKKDGSYDVNEWSIPAEVLVNISPKEFFASHLYPTQIKPIIYKNYFLETLEFIDSPEPSVITLVEGKLWKEYGVNKYWSKTGP